jgi:hypothetical protein
MTRDFKDLADSLAHLLDRESRPRKARAAPLWRSGVVGGASAGKSSNTPLGAPARRLHVLKQALSRSPEVMVKITGTNKEVTPLKAHLDYLRRKPGAEIEDERGNALEATPEAMKSILRMWGVAVAEGYDNAATRREGLRNGRDQDTHDSRGVIAVHIVFSMPAGTNAALVMDATRGFAADEFSNHQYVLVLHKDRDHPHVHVVVNNVGNDLRRLPRKRADLQRWREVFAEQLRERGIEAAATPRSVRGVLNKGESFGFLKLKDRVARDRATAIAEGRPYVPKKPVHALRESAKRAIEEAQGLRVIAQTRAAKIRQELIDALKAESDRRIGESVRDVLAAFAADAQAQKSRVEEMRDLAANPKSTSKSVNVDDAHNPKKRRGPER